jgi:predicted NAD/FAD-dependent oxidoreductase
MRQQTDCVTVNPPNPLVVLLPTLSSSPCYTFVLLLEFHRISCPYQTHGMKRIRTRTQRLKTLVWSAHPCSARTVPHAPKVCVRAQSQWASHSVHAQLLRLRRKA